MRRIQTSLALAALLVVFRAHGDDGKGGASEANEASAREAMRRGIAAFGSGDAETALASYLEAEKYVPEANAPYRYAAEALFKLGRYQEAIDSLRKYLALRPNVSDAADVRQQILDIQTEHLPGRIALTCTPKAAQDAAVFVDHSLSSAQKCTSELELSPGRHSLRVHLDGYEDLVFRVEVVGNKTKDLIIPLTAARAVKQGIPMRTWGWTIGGTGVALLVAGAVCDGLLGSTVSKFHSATASGGADAESLWSQAHELRVLSLVGYGVGGAALATGAAMILLGGDGHGKGAPTTGFLSPGGRLGGAVWGAPGGAGVSARGVW